jgi:hypothetical protein
MPGPSDIEIVCADEDAFGYATFQSHNQKVVRNRNGIFMTYLKKRFNREYTAQQWRLLRSTDGGKTFSVVFEATDATNPPVLETDEADNLYLARPDFVDRNAYLYRFLASEGYARPHISKIEKGSAGKYCMMYDRERGQLYYFAHNNTFHVVGLDGTVRRSGTIMKKGETACLQYPHLSLDLDGTLHAAWTTNKNDEYLYTDIHYMKSVDGGGTWRKMDGTPLELPVIADYHGATDQINLNDEYDYHTWLSSFMVKNGKLHFVYKYAAPGDAMREHYVRYDLKTAQREIDLWPEFKGETISLNNPDGFFASRASDPGSPLYCTLVQDGRIACLRSDDNGTTWHDHAVSSRRFGVNEKMNNPYSVGGSREVTEDGWVLGSFTDRIPNPGQIKDLTAAGMSAPVYFFRFRANPKG